MLLHYQHNYDPCIPTPLQRKGFETFSFGNRGKRTPTSSASSRHSPGRSANPAAFEGFRCSTCWRVFSQKCNLVRHEEVHKEVRTVHQCRFCPKSFGRKDNLKCHEKLAH
ncbi:hypothetical protein CEXT_384801 [Caerostris extrusa]|uniref:C2H2-type domain-containing protein n=1 Tax=Caerostris extrusa TaxID=172846 RepID=A0AAV4RRZ7_CAEEX|nr:hypothetical protein CEXT_384801 [Caerostris extrusa]